MTRNDFAVFILTHGRADKQITLQTLYTIGYSGKIYLVVDDEDSQLEEYREKYGELVVVFSKREAEKEFDTMTNRKEYRSVVFARNAAFGIAKQLGIKWFMTCDDDISNLSYRVPKENKLKGINVRDADRLFMDMVEFAEGNGISVFGFSQAGAYVGGLNSKKYRDGCQRNISQMMMYNAEDRVTIRGLFNEDLHLSIDSGLNGQIALATMLVCITSPERMTNKGGLHDLYKENNTYVRDFYSKMAHPSVVNFVEKDNEWHIRINHSAFAPMIVSSRYRKAVAE